MSVLRFTCLCLLVARGAFSVTINLGVMASFGPDRGNLNSIWSFERIASAVSLALEDFQDRTGRLKNETFRMEWRHGRCNPGYDIKILADFYYSYRPDVIFGLSCSIVIVPIGRYLSFWKVAHFPHGGTDPRLTDRSIYTTLVRIHASGDKIAKAFTNMFAEYGWGRAAMITSYGFCDLAARGILPALQETGVIITEWIRPPQAGSQMFELQQFLDQVRQRARVIIICLDKRQNQFDLLRLAYEQGMTAPNYVFLNYGNSIGRSTYEPWTRLGDLPPELIKYWRELLVSVNFKQVLQAGFGGQKFEDFYDEIPIRFTQPPWNFNMSLERGWRGSTKAVDIYETALAYFTALDEVLREGGDYTNGEVIQQKVRNMVIYGLRGKVLFDENGDRVPDYWILDIHPDWETYKEVIKVSPAEAPGQRFIPIDNRTIYWGTEDNLPPPDSPICGFNNEKCQEDASGTTAIISGSSVGGVIFLLIVILGYIMHRRYQEEQALQQTVWKVDFSDIVVGKTRAGSVANMSQRSLRSGGSDGSGGEGQGTRQMFTEVGMYKGNLVAILRVEKTHVDLTKTDLKELKAMKDMNHNNLAIFVGACVDAPNVSYIIHYYTKGSLQDIIENEIIGLDWMFKTSLLSDLANGMSYLHKSELGGHGSLKSSCCLVDSRWQLKVSSYGLHAFRTGQLNKDIGDYEKYHKLLWTAPELLRVPRDHWPRYGTQAADAYSFGVIAQEVIYRTGPYFIDTESPKEFISRLAREDRQPYRPVLPKVDDDTPPDAVGLVKACWEEDPSARPTFPELLKMIKSINKGQKVDILSSLIDKLEKYANNLEDIVNQRTGELVVEKKRTEKLLESMLPASVVEELKHGRTVEAELFSAVTIFFSDIVGFTALSLESSPLEIVNLLNDLYSLFDDMISLYDVYKMETIGDSYMVVSGLPRRNGDSHVGEIASLALDLMSSALTFSIRHRPGLKLQLRIGFHTGPCAAGVVGLSMPRYCLFGDTVNMASRMETNGKALMIHMSKYAFAALDKLVGYKTKPRGEMQIKGKGLQMTYWLLGKEGFNKRLPVFQE